MTEENSFSFGKNWQSFLCHITEDRVQLAKQSLTEFLNTENLQGKTFLDIGCGSGLFSLSAYNLSADRIVSFDVDPFSVQCCKHMHLKAGYPENWQVTEGSILDSAFARDLGRFDIVYSWGVLHHTGNMWEAIKNAADRVGPEGKLYIALYNKTHGLNGSRLWLRIKKFYNFLPAPGKKVLEFLYSAMFCFTQLIRLKNPVTSIRNYQSKRGMNFITDVRDWLGGYPYEFASTDEVIGFIKQHYPDFHLINLQSTPGTGNNWFLFQNASQR